ncbi:GNAT family N-acetyltransferase [Clostridium sp. FP2]|uniref:GNAT family N-acetyltransferase n=1 Tax=Clostridium sp. FP2 TaxID=2724481 RepID=UPI0013E91735|nr:GNAT family N-acetyltransferase [Clostridium sp. FP2]MBZ9621452.1 GNAT family N-acetyltransferase [Clostridium sp. FP2]
MAELRYPIIEDSESFFRILTEGKFEFYYATIPESIESEKEWIKRREYKRANNLEYNYSIIYNNNVVGGCEIRIFKDNPHIGELGYFIDRNFSNKGIASEVVKKLEKIAFDELGLMRLEIHMDPQNRASEKVAIKNNFEKEGLLKKAIKFQDSYYDNLMYAKIK